MRGEYQPQADFKVNKMWLIGRDYLKAAQLITRVSIGSPWDEERILKLLQKRNVVGMVVLPPAANGDTILGTFAYTINKESADLHLHFIGWDDRVPEAGRMTVRAVVEKARERAEKSPREEGMIQVESAYIYVQTDDDRLLELLKQHGFYLDTHWDPERQARVATTYKYKGKKCYKMIYRFI